jgi:replicative superfamily II helicase
MLKCTVVLRRWSRNYRSVKAVLLDEIHKITKDFF